MDVLVNRCGNIFINNISEDDLRKILYSYLIKYCYDSINKNSIYKNNIDYDKISNIKMRYNNSDIEQDNIQNNFIQNYSFLTTEEQYFIERMSTCIEMGIDYIDVLKEEFNLTKEQILEKIVTIREKISNSDYLLDIGKSKYLKKVKH